MFELVQNVGESEGGKVQKQLCGRALTLVLLWPVRTSLKHGITKHKSISSHGHSHSKILTISKIIINFVYPTVQATVSRNSMPIPRLRKGTLSPPTPRVGSIGFAQKYFPDFHQGVFQ